MLLGLVVGVKLFPSSIGLVVQESERRKRRKVQRVLCGIHLVPLRYSSLSISLLGPICRFVAPFFCRIRSLVDLIWFSISKPTAAKELFEFPEHGECRVEGVRGGAAECSLSWDVFFVPRIFFFVGAGSCADLFTVIHRCISSAHSSCALFRWGHVSVSCLSKVTRDGTDKQHALLIRLPLQPLRLPAPRGIWFPSLLSFVAHLWLSKALLSLSTDSS